MSGAESLLVMLRQRKGFNSKSIFVEAWVILSCKEGRWVVLNAIKRFILGHEWRRRHG